MSRKTKVESLKTKMHLLDVAIEEFSTRGYAATTLMDIAGSAGVTRGAIYWHFESKTELFNEIWYREKPIYSQIKGDELILPGSNPLAELKNLLINGIKLVATEPKQRDLINIILHKCEFTQPMLSSQDIRQMIYINHQRMEMMLDACKDRKQLPASLNSKQSADLICAYFTGVFGNWLAYPGVFNLYRDAERIVSQLIYMLNYTDNDHV